MSETVKGNSLLVANALARLIVLAAAVLVRQEFAQVQEPRPRQARRVADSQQLEVCQHRQWRLVVLKLLRLAPRMAAHHSTRLE
jgi:hypothetical protein